jgi:hypothetical protein
VFTRAQARTHGIDDDRLDRRVRTGRWQRIHPRVFATFTGPLPHAARLWAAVLYASPGAVLCLESAANEWKLVDRQPAAVHVMIDRSAPLRAVAGVKVHRTLVLGRGDVHMSQRPPRTTVERTVVDLVRRTSTADDVAALVAAAVQRGLASPARLDRALAAQRRLPHGTFARDVLALASSGAHSVLEMHFARACARHGLPAPDRQHVRSGPAGMIYVDAYFAEYDVAVELDGRLGHMAVHGWWADMRRDNRLQAAGTAVLRFPGFVVLSDGCGVAHETAAVLAGRGRRPPFRRCPRCRDFDATVGARSAP